MELDGAVTQRTYWHLQAERRVPSSYEIATSRLLYYPERGFEVETPVAAWYRRHQAGLSLSPEAWERFRDPRETTYAKYVAIASDRESFVDALLRSVGGSSPPKADWLQAQGRLVAVLRYPCHGLQMVAAYVGQMAPAGRVVMCFAFQAADELRRVQRWAQRTQELETLQPGVAEAARQVWLKDASWQPLRRLVETLLVTYDFGEALVALNLVVKPLFDRLFLAGLAQLAQSRGDTVLAKICFSLEEDARWQREFSAALVRLVLDADPGNRASLESWIQRWYPPTSAALSSLFGSWEASEKSSEELSWDLDAHVRGYWASMGIEMGGPA